MGTIKKFYEALSNNEDMRKRMSELNEKYKDAQPDEETMLAEAVAFAKAEGFDVTADNFRAYLKTGSAELSEEALEAVAGGQDNVNSACFCIAGGGGKKNGYTCGCVAIGTGNFLDGTGLICSVVGIVGKIN